MNWRSVDPRQPPAHGTYGLDLSNPLCQALVDCIICDDPAGHDFPNLAAAQFPALAFSSETNHRNFAGRSGLFTSGASGMTGLRIPSHGPLMGNPAGGTLRLVWTPLGLNSFGMFASKATGSGTTRELLMDVNVGGGSSVIGFQWMNSGFGNATLPAPLVVGTWYDMFVVITLAKATFWMNGVSFSNAYVLGSATAPAAPLQIGGRQDGQAGIDMITSQVQRWNRALRPSEIMQLLAEPYAMLAPLRPRSYFVPTAAAPAVTNISQYDYYYRRRRSA